MEQSNLVDLHVHSSASDGTLTPAEVVCLAFDAGLRAIALTDHDTVSGIGEALAEVERIREEYRKRQNKETVFEVVPGIEISCNYEGKELHILGFYVDAENEAFLEGLEEIRQKRIRRNEQMAALCIEYGMDISMEELYHGNPGTVVTRRQKHLRNILVRAVPFICQSPILHQNMRWSYCIWQVQFRCLPIRYSTVWGMHS